MRCAGRRARLLSKKAARTESHEDDVRDCKESGAHDYEVVDGRNRDECGAQDDVRDCKESGAHDYEVVDGRNRDECGAQDDVRDCFPRKRRARLRGRFVRPEF